MLFLLISASWILTLLLIVSLCSAARSGDLQQDQPTDLITGVPGDAEVVSPPPVRPLVRPQRSSVGASRGLSLASRSTIP